MVAVKRYAALMLLECTGTSTVSLFDA